MELEWRRGERVASGSSGGGCGSGGGRGRGGGQRGAEVKVRAAYVGAELGCRQ